MQSLAPNALWVPATIYILCLLYNSTAIYDLGDHVTKLVPKLVPVEECVDVPKVIKVERMEE